MALIPIKTSMRLHVSSLAYQENISLMRCVTKSCDNPILHTTKTQKLVSGHTHNFLRHRLLGVSRLNRFYSV